MTDADAVTAWAQRLTFHANSETRGLPPVLRREVLSIISAGATPTSWTEAQRVARYGGPDVADAVQRIARLVGTATPARTAARTAPRPGIVTHPDPGQAAIEASIRARLPAGACQPGGYLETRPGHYVAVNP